MTDLQIIKKRIYEEQKIEEILQLLGCGSVSEEQNGNLFVASLPDGDNPRSVQVKNNESLSSSIRTRNISGDIYDLVSYIVYDAQSERELKETLPKSKFWICLKLNYYEFIDEFYKATSRESDQLRKVDYNKWLKKLQPKNNNILYNAVIDEKILEKYGDIPYLEWIKEGIDYHTQKYFQVGIDVQSERVTFPVHNINGELIGVKGRYCGDRKTVEDRYKYIYLEPCNKSFEFFNLHRALPHIKKANKVIIVEGAKTVMLLWSWGYKNVISIEGDALSNIQLNLLKDLGMFTKYVFAFDKDKDADYVGNEVRKLKGRKTYAICDRENYLEKKDSPTDKGRKVWEKLLENNVYRVK